MPKPREKNWFRSRRLELGMSRMQLAALLQVHHNSVAHWERGLSVPQRRLIPEVAAALQVSIEDIGIAMVKSRRVA